LRSGSAVSTCRLDAFNDEEDHDPDDQRSDDFVGDQAHETVDAAVESAVELQQDGAERIDHRDCSVPM
jgi:hypothetical protein